VHPTPEAHVRARSALALVPLLALGAAGHVSAAPAKAPQVKDATGDAVTRQAGNDIVSATWTTTGSGSGKAYKPKQLVVSLTLAAPPSSTPTFTYEVEATTSTCGDVAFTYEPGTPYESVTGLNGWADWGDCLLADDSSIELLTPKVKGSTITWSFSLKASPVKAGAVLTDFRARVDPSNPVLPFPSSSQTGENGLVDSATGTGSWKVS
jgi:hypothetical protein